MVLAIYSFLLALALILGAPWWVTRMLTSGRYRAGLAGRLGRIPAALRQLPRIQPLIWLHAVSVGEVLAATQLIRDLEQEGFQLAISTTTQAGQQLARTRFPNSPVFYIPLDLAFLMRRYLRVLAPVLIVTMESELWPNLIHAAKSAQIPLAVANARISDRSFPRYMRLRPLWSPLLREVSLFLAQSEETANRLARMGVNPANIRTTGNLKYDVKAPTETAITTRICTWTQALDSKLVIAGSTLPGEESLLLDTWLNVQKAIVPTTALLLIAPRHTPRFAEVFNLIQQRGFTPIRCSTLPDHAPHTHLSGNVVLLLDTIGDLANLYSAATLAFVGGSLVPKGGHNPLEPAQFAVPVVMGPSYENFREIVELMRSQNAIEVVPPEALQQTLITLLTNPTEIGQRGRQIFQSQSGATARTLTALRELLP